MYRNRSRLREGAAPPTVINYLLFVIPTQDYKTSALSEEEELTLALQLSREASLEDRARFSRYACPSYRSFFRFCVIASNTEVFSHPDLVVPDPNAQMSSVEHIC